MKDITREYLLLFNTVADLESELETLQTRLRLAMQEAESLYLEGCETGEALPLQSAS